VAAVLANATDTTLVNNQRAGTGAGPPDAAGCEPHRPSSRHWGRRLVQVLQQLYMFHRKCTHYLSTKSLLHCDRR